MSVAFDTIGHPTNQGGKLLEQKKMSNILSELTALVDYKKKVQDTTKKALISINTLVSVNANLTRSLETFQSKADKKKQTVQRNYEKQLLNIDSEFQTKIQSLNAQIVENKLTITTLHAGIENLNDNIGLVSTVESTTNTKETKTRKSFIRVKSRLSTQNIKDLISELVKKEEKGAITIKFVMTKIDNRYGNILTHEETRGKSNSLIYARVYAILGKMRKSGELYKGTGDGLVVRKVSSSEPLTTTG